MFPKNNRFNLRQEKDFFKKAKRKSFPSFQVFWVSSETETPVFSVVVPKKVSLKATVRHKILRQMRQILVRSATKFHYKKVVVVLFHSSLRKSYQELEEEVERITL